MASNEKTDGTRVGTFDSNQHHADGAIASVTDLATKFCFYVALGVSLFHKQGCANMEPRKNLANDQADDRPLDQAGTAGDSAQNSASSVSPPSSSGTPGKESSGNWSEQLESESFDQQVAALRQIARAGDAQGVTAQAVHLAGSPHDEVRVWAAEALESSVRPAAHEADVLVRQLAESRDGEVCYWSATMLGRIGEAIGGDPQAASAAVSALESCLRDSMYLPARERAAWALRQLGPVSISAVPTLRAVADDAPPRLPRLTKEAIKALDAAA
tara:strand:- start:493669 stop:494484 length:816 start_codon:yes stop_codon:yes gene_type:complete